MAKRGTKYVVTWHGPIAHQKKAEGKQKIRVQA